MADKALTKFLDQMAPDHLKVEDNLGEGFVRLRISEAQRRQAKQDIRFVEDAVIELLRNAKDAGAKNILLATWKEAGSRHISIIDDGDGIPENLCETIFEPRVTSKLDTVHTDSWGVHGRGMALYSIRENAQSARVVSSIYKPKIPNEPTKVFRTGSALSVVFDNADVPERKDQSTLPLLNYSKDEGWYLGAGAHNIARIVSEFALENRHVCTVYMGSAVDVAATAHAFGFHAMRAYNSQKLKQTDSQIPDALEFGIHEVAPLYRLAWADSAENFAHIARDLGLFLSSRSAYRIFNRSIEPLRPLLELLPRDTSAQAKELFPQKEGSKDSARTNNKDFRGLVFDTSDKQTFLSQVKHAYAHLAEQYYLDDAIEPAMRIVGNELRISIPVIKK
ncbi:MAG: ATP-binding protein [Eggerthellaceae bacterium]|nr:ATP-binding protein [Eggerthellaceae bacterium]